MDTSKTNQGAILIFHLITEGQVYDHAVSYAPGVDEFLVFAQIASMDQTNRRILQAPGVVSYVGNVRGSYDEYLYWSQHGGRKFICPVCMPATKGKDNE